MRDMRAKQRAAKGLPPIEAVSKAIKVAEPLVVAAPVTVEVSSEPVVDDVLESAQVDDEFIPEPELNADLAEFDDEADDVIASKGGRRKPVSKALMDAFESDDFSYDFD